MIHPHHYLSDQTPSPVLHVTLNSTNLFTTSTTEGWVVYRINPLQIMSRRVFPNSSLKIVQPLASTNLLLLVGGPPSPLYPPNKVLFWDDKLGKTVVELEFSEDVRGLAVRGDRLVVVLLRRIILYALGRGPLGVYREGIYDTTENPKGLVALATEEGSTLLAIPGLQAGQIRIIHLPPLNSKAPPLPPPPSHDPTKTPFPSVAIISAHESALSALATTASGASISTASIKGTLVRVWEVRSGGLLRELRRGTDPAEIFDISLRPDGGAICVSSDKGTVHVWDLLNPRDETRKSDSDSMDYTRTKQFSLLKPYLPKYFSSEWSHSQFRLPPPSPAPSRLPRSLANAHERGVVAPTLEDDVCICTWIEVEKPASRERSGGSRSPLPSSKGKEREERRSSPSSSTKPGPPRNEPRLPEKEFQVVALTTSGGYFRISVGGDSAPTKTPAELANLGPGLGKDSTSDCRLEEYRRFGSKDGW